MLDGSYLTSGVAEVLLMRLSATVCPGPAGESAGGAICVHDARARLTTAAATTRADHDLSRSRQATRIPIRFPDPHQHDTTTAYGIQASWRQARAGP